ncbi:hypothetical protein L873DRAFT_1847319 [Choiromyces venosus 120613-1]|uniref:CHAT domain-containing protein n=1 Tax=Choiromyces venosus 120613-1 TaxID=1336337 RepID=A0A3N4J4G7_9PEZI|nr:hypothetical protein L873DRAFT_1847319 [Choiromyces venosus 120613-1]
MTLSAFTWKRGIVKCHHLGTGFLVSAQKVAHLLYTGGHFNKSSSILKDAVNLMPRVNLQLLKCNDQQYILSALSGLAAISSSVTLLAKRGAYNSLRLLELGRAVIMGIAIDSGSDILEFQNNHLHLFHKFDRLRVEIDSPMDEVKRNPDETLDQCINHAVSRHMEAVNKMEKTLAHIPTLPGYHRYMLPPSLDALMKMAANGLVIILNSTNYRSDAIIVTTSAITLLELPKLHYEETTQHIGQLARFEQGSQELLRCAVNNKKMEDLLLWLWNKAWVGVGQLSMVPFHVAGDHSPGSACNTLSRAASSYIATIKTLSYAQQTEFRLFNNPIIGPSIQPGQSENTQLLLVLMPTIPGVRDLQCIDNEVQEILNSPSERAINAALLHNPTTADVLAKVWCSNIIHFACHAVPNTNPSNSHLLLLIPDGNNANKLMVRDISNVNTQNSQLAYLSACSSTKNISDDLVDKVIHLASGFQVAGFTHILENKWESQDTTYGEVTREFHWLLFNNDGNVDGNRRVAMAFHEVMKRL